MREEGALSGAAHTHYRATLSTVVLGGEWRGEKRRGGNGVEGRGEKLQYWITTCQARASLLVAEHAAFRHNK